MTPVIVAIAPFVPGDNRLNADDSVWAPLTLYCAGSTGADGISVWRIDLNGNGQFAVGANGAQISAQVVAAQQTGEHQLIASNGDLSFWALSSGELQVQAPNLREPDKLYVHVFPVDICGALPASSTPATVPDTDDPPSSTFIPSAPPASSASQPVVTGGQTHVVQAGENLFRIALRYGVSLDTLAAVNNITDVSLIFVGQVLIIP